MNLPPSNRRRPSRRPWRAALVLCGMLATASCGLLGLGGSDEPEEVAAVLVESEPLESGVRCFSCGDLYLSGELQPSDLGVLARRGVSTVVDLRALDATDELSVEAQTLGLRYVALPIATELPTDAQVSRVLAELALERDGLLSLVCATGSRSAIFFAIQCATVGGADLEAALEAARTAGMKPGEPEEFVRAQVEQRTVAPVEG